MKEIIEFKLHFDTQNHYIPFYNFINFTKGIELIANDINQNAFENRLKYQVVVLPPEEGSFLHKVGFVIAGSAVTLSQAAQFLDTEVASNYVKGLTGKTPGEYAEEVGESHSEIIESVLVSSTESAISQGSCQLRENGFDIKHNLIRGTNLIYETCVENNDIKGFGFDDEDNFPIKRELFEKKIYKQNTSDTRYEIMEVVIVQPVTTNNSKNQWHGKDKVTKTAISFYMKDKIFLNNFLKGKYPIKTSNEDDIAVIGIEFKKELDEKSGKEKEIRSALKVYQWNDKELEELPEDYSGNDLYLKALGVNPNQPRLT